MAGGGEPFRPFPHGVLLDECSAGLCPERLEPERGFNPFTRSSLSGLERELSTLFSMVCKQVTRLRTEKPRTGAARAGFSTLVTWADRV